MILVEQCQLDAGRFYSARQFLKQQFKFLSHPLVVSSIDARKQVMIWVGNNFIEMNWFNEI